MSEKIKEYVIFESDDPCKLEEAVNSAIADDFVPVGGIAVCAIFSSWENERKGYTENCTDYTYSQAMIKYFL